MFRSWLRRRRHTRETHRALWTAFKTVGPDGRNALQREFETALRGRLGPSVVIEQDIEHDCDGKDVLWLTVQPQNLQIAISEGLIRVAGRYFYEESGGSPAEIINHACEKVVALAGHGA